MAMIRKRASVTHPPIPPFRKERVRMGHPRLRQSTMKAFAHAGLGICCRYCRAPDGAEPAGVGDGEAGVGHQVVEKVEFLGSEVDDLAGFADHAALGVEFDFADLDGRVGGLGGGLAVAAGGANSGGEFAEGEGFGDVVVGAGFEGFGLVVFAVADGEHEDREARGKLANAATGLAAAHAGHVNVEQDRGEGVGAGEGFVVDV